MSTNLTNSMAIFGLFFLVFTCCSSAHSVDATSHANDRIFIKNAIGKLDAAATNKDLDGYTAFTTADFVSIDAKGVVTVRGKSQQREKIGQWFAESTRVERTTTITNITFVNGSAIVGETVHSVITTTVDGHDTVTENSSILRNFWVQAGKEWLEKRSRTTSTTTTIIKQAKWLDAGWVTLSELTSVPYYQDNILPTGQATSLKPAFLRFLATSRLSDLEKNGNDSQKHAATAAIRIVGETAVAESEQTMSGVDPQSAQKRADDMIVEVMEHPNSDDAVASALESALRSALEAANANARARYKANQDAASLSGLWSDNVLPAVRSESGPDTAYSLLKVESGGTFDEYSKLGHNNINPGAMWMSATNIGKETLHNCTLLITILHGGRLVYYPQNLFIPEWPAGKTIYDEFFDNTLMFVPPPAYAAASDPIFTAQYEMWSDESHLPEQDAIVANGQDIHDKFRDALGW